MAMDRTTKPTPLTAASGSIPGMITYIRPGQRRVEIGNLQSWRHLLAQEDERCVESGFSAGVLSISFGSSRGVEIDGLTADQRMAEVIDVVLDTVAFTDRVCMLSPTELAVLIIPLPDVHEAELRAIAVDVALRDAGIDAGIGWAVRRPLGSMGDGPLQAAAARADANAATAHGRHLRLV